MSDPEIVVNVNRLRILRELAQRGTIAAVADALWLTSSAVSQQLSALERETGVALIERAGRGVRLTVAGQVLAEHSERVFDALDAAVSSLRSLQSTPSGRLRLRGFPSVVRFMFPLVLQRLQELFPHLEIEIEDAEGEQSLEAVRLGHADVAVIDDLTWETATRRDNFRTTELFAVQMVVVMGTEHEWADRTSVAWSELAGRRQVSEQRSSLFARSVEESCRAAGITPEVAARVHDASAALALVETGQFIGVLPDLQMIGRTERVRWCPLEPTVERRLLAVTRAQVETQPAVRAVLDELVRLTDLSPLKPEATA